MDSEGRSRASSRVAARCGVLVAVVLAICVGGASARAQSASESSSDAIAARALFHEGVELSDAGDWPEAVDRFRRALALRDSPIIAYNLGVALAHTDHPVEAAERFRRVVRDEAASEAARTEARRDLARAEAAIAWLVVDWSGDPRSHSLEVDDEPRAIELLGTEIPLDPGAHEIEVLRGERVVATGTYTVRAGQHASLTLETLALPEPVDEDEVVAPAAPASAPAHGGGEDPAPFIALGVGGGVALVAGAIVLAVVLTPAPEAMPRAGSLGTVEVGR